MTDMTSQAQGDALETAVRAIEAAILRTFPGYTEDTFKIEGKKIIRHEGVRHEIDLHVTIDAQHGYSAAFIFECKNWKEKVGKNEIIIFSEKIAATNAQRGFFVAKSYTADAAAQAAKDSRMELLTAEELDPEAILVPCEFHGIRMLPPQASVEILTVGEKATDGFASITHPS